VRIFAAPNSIIMYYRLLSKKTFVLFVALFFVSIQILFSQGTTCATSELITINGACDVATINDATVTTDSYTCGGTIGREGWYTFTINGTTAVTITGDAANRNIALQLLSGSCAGLSQVACDNTTNVGGADIETIGPTTLSAGTYYVKVLNLTANNMTLNSLCLTATPAVNSATIASTQSVCQGSAVSLTSSYTVYSGAPGVAYQWYSNTTNSNSGGTAIGGATSSTYSPPTGVAGTYYYYCCIYTPATNTSSNGPKSNVVTITVSAPPTTSAAGPDQTTGSCVTTATLAANTPTSGTGTWTIISGPGTVTTPGSPTSTVTGLSAGVSTTLRWTISNAPCTASTDDVIITGGACSNNDLCSGGIAVTCNNSYNGTTVGMNTETGLPGCSTPSGPGVWYILAGTGGSVTASLCGSAYDTYINVYSGSSCAAITACEGNNDDFCGLQSQVTFNTTIGTNYYILVNGYSGATGTFTLTLSCCAGTVPSCATSPSPANATTNYNTCNSISWTAPACNAPTSYDVYFGTTNPPPYVTNVSTTSYTPSLSGNTTYYWEIRPRNASGPAPSCSVWSFTTTPNPQYNIVDAATSIAPYNCVTLTPASNVQRGCAWDQNSTLAFASNFSYDFTINLGSDNNGADGIAFVIQNDPIGRCKCGLTGDQLGAGGILNSLIIEVDTYLNYDDRDDGLPTVICVGGPEPDHMDLWLNGNVNPTGSGSGCSPAGTRVIPAAIPLLNGGLDYDIENGLDHILRISWNAGTTTLTAKVMNLATTATYGIITYSFNPLTVFGTNNPYFGFTASTGGLNNQQSFCLPATLLPVEMSDFNMNCDNGNVSLNWSTNSEHNNDYFKIEKSRNGQEYTLKSIIDGAGNSSNTIAYNWIDDENSTEVNYYRLSQVDFDGVEKVLNVISSNCSELSGVKINSLLQNDGQLVLMLTNELKGNYSIEITDCTGKIIATRIATLESGSHAISFNDVQTSQGIYFVRVSNSIASVVKKVGVF